MDFSVLEEALLKQNEQLTRIADTLDFIANYKYDMDENKKQVELHRKREREFEKETDKSMGWDQK